MSTFTSPYVFISYRRADALAAARGLLRFLRAHYGKESVFMDTAEIRVGDDWEHRLEEALKRATIVIPVIGNQWFAVKDVFDQRRIDQDNDWVRREIVHALENGKKVIPVYVGIKEPPAQAFPECLKKLARLQSRTVTNQDAESEWKLLATDLQASGLGPLRPDVRYPRAMVQLQPITGDALREALSQLPGWGPVASPVPGMEHVTRSELHACFEFDSFKKALAFMSDAAAEINKTQHHPRWENIWRSVNVYLSTWDLQFQLSQLDIDLAIHLTQTARRHGGRLL